MVTLHDLSTFFFFLGFIDVRLGPLNVLHMPALSYPVYLMNITSSVYDLTSGRP